MPPILEISLSVFVFSSVGNARVVCILFTDYSLCFNLLLHFPFPFFSSSIPLPNFYPLFGSEKFFLELTNQNPKLPNILKPINKIM